MPGQGGRQKAVEEKLDKLGHSWEQDAYLGPRIELQGAHEHRQAVLLSSLSALESD